MIFVGPFQLNLSYRILSCPVLLFSTVESLFPECHNQFQVMQVLERLGEKMIMEGKLSTATIKERSMRVEGE